MKKLNLYLSIVLIIFFVSFNLNAQNFSKQKGGHCYTLDIPDYMERTFQLNDYATLQYMSFQHEAYVIVIVDDKEELKELEIVFEDSNNFLENFVMDYKVDKANRRLGLVQNFEANGNSHTQVELTWYEDDNDFYMLITAVETKTHFYKIMCWTLLENKNKLKDDYIRISKSLQD